MCTAEESGVSYRVTRNGLLDQAEHSILTCARPMMDPLILKLQLKASPLQSLLAEKHF
jgi:hypothetical protein